MQTKCLRLMGKKLLVALTLEGKFAGEGLHDVEEDDDMLSAMARELVENNGIGETADAVWAQLRQVHDQLPSAVHQWSPASLEEAMFEEVALDNPASESGIDFPWRETMEQPQLVTDFTAIPTPTLFGQSLSSGRRRGKRTREANPFQGSLFGVN